MIHSTIARVRNQRNLRNQQNNPADTEEEGEQVGAEGPAEFDTEGTIKKFDQNVNANPPVPVVNSNKMGKGSKVDAQNEERSV